MAYYLFVREQVVGCWADDADEAADYLADRNVDPIAESGNGRLLGVIPTSPLCGPSSTFAPSEVPQGIRDQFPDGNWDEELILE